MDVLKRVIEATKAKKRGSNWQGICPAHDDHNPSLSIADQNGKILVKCHAGCAQKAILNALGRMGVSLSAKVPHEKKATVKTEYTYHDEQGNAVCKKIRMSFFDGSKKFFWQHWDGRSWQKGKGDFALVPYRYFDWKGDSEIFLVEGEKASECLWKNNIKSTTTGGSTSWEPRFVEYFKDKSVTLLPDYDDAGYKYINSAANDFVSAGITVKILKLPNLPVGGDVVDYFVAGGSRENFLTISADAPIWSTRPIEDTPKRTHGFQIWSLGDLLNREDLKQDWIWDKILPTRSLSVMVGRPKSGKTTMLRSLCLAVARGNDFLSRPTQKGPVILFGLEEHPAYLKGYFEQAGADHNDPISVVFGELPNNRIESLAALLTEVKPSLVVIDTLFKFHGVEDTSSYSQTSEVLHRLTTVARGFPGAIVLVHHQRKNDSDDLPPF